MKAAMHPAPTATGFVETRGLVGVIQAADAAAKAADVHIGGFVEVGGGLVSVRFSGDVASVQAAMAVAVEAAGQVSQVISHHVIPAPHADVRSLLEPGAGRHQVQEQQPLPAPAAPPEAAAENLADLPVARLRQLVRAEPEARLKGREVSRANKEALLLELRRLQQEDTRG